MKLLLTKNKLRVFITFQLFLFHFNSHSQLDSVSISASFETTAQVFQGDSTQLNTISVLTWVNDFDFLGYIIITVYDVEYDFPIDKQKLTKAQITENNSIVNGVITAKALSIEDNRSYRIEVLVSDFQGLFLPLQSLTLLNN